MKYFIAFKVRDILLDFLLYLLLQGCNLACPWCDTKYAICFYIKLFRDVMSIRIKDTFKDINTCFINTVFFQAEIIGAV